MGLEVIFFMNNKAIQAYWAGYIEINIFVISKVIYALEVFSFKSNAAAVNFFN